MVSGPVILAVGMKIDRIPDEDLKRKVIEVDNIFAHMHLYLCMWIGCAFIGTLMLTLTASSMLLDFGGLAFLLCSIVMGFFILYALNKFGLRPLFKWKIGMLEGDLMELVNRDAGYIKAIEKAGEINPYSTANAKYYLDKLKVEHSL